MSHVFEWRDAPQARFAVIGDPIAHSLSPQMQNAALRAMGEEGEYVAVQASPADLCKALNHLYKLGYEGLNVTVPHKEAVLDWLADTDDFATWVGAANTIDLVRKRGTNTDGPGFLASLVQFKFKPQSSALVFGSGGSSRAICAALAQEGWSVKIWNRTPERARAMVEELEGRAPSRSLDVEIVEGELQGLDVAANDLLVNTTSAHLQGPGAPAMPWSQLAWKGQAVSCDLAYGESAFITAAAKAGLRTMDGKSMLMEQGALALEWWLRKPAPRQVMAEAIR